MKKLLAVFAIVALAGSANAKPKGPYFEGKHPVFVVICVPNGPCTGVYMDKAQAVRMHIPRCSAKITNFCYM